MSGYPTIGYLATLSVSGNPADNTPGGARGQFQAVRALIEDPCGLDRMTSQGYKVAGKGRINYCVGMVPKTLMLSAAMIFLTTRRTLGLGLKAQSLDPGLEMRRIGYHLSGRLLERLRDTSLLGLKAEDHKMHGLNAPLLM